MTCPSEFASEFVFSLMTCPSEFCSDDLSLRIFLMTCPSEFSQNLIKGVAESRNETFDYTHSSSPELAQKHPPKDSSPPARKPARSLVAQATLALGAMLLAQGSKKQKPGLRAGIFWISAAKFAPVQPRPATGQAGIRTPGIHPAQASPLP